MIFIMVDIEADGPIPGDYSMLSFGAVVVEKGLKLTFQATLRPISEKFVPEALAVGHYTREQTLEFGDPKQAMEEFARWLAGLGEQKFWFVSDNNGFDWMFIAWYFHHFLGTNPFGHSSTNLGSPYKGLVKDTGKTFKHLRNEALTHDPLEDAVANAEVMLLLRETHGLKF